MAHSDYDHDYDQTTKRPALSTHQHRIPLLEAKMMYPLACLMLLPLLLLLMLLLLRLLTWRQIHQLLLVSAVQPTSRITRAASLALASWLWPTWLWPTWLQKVAWSPLSNPGLASSPPNLPNGVQSRGRKLLTNQSKIPQFFDSVCNSTTPPCKLLQGRMHRRLYLHSHSPPRSPTVSHTDHLPLPDSGMLVLTSQSGSQSM